ncbi:MBOAT family protein [uncultured Psychroserpens sp.]|uniref:MBOAT family O-acyltransferase n=1 Tax=uncultured Psychroserpens sp. TaxID=255436 RepID=UPI0026197A29|nr:MBOAT family O-acyltransferase [uncultured Psychroserpens sp.]
MFFNSIDFAIFLPIVFFLYWLVTNKYLKLQNLLIVIASYVFYGCWDYRFLALILFSTIVDFSVGKMLISIDNNKKRRLLLWVSIAVNIGLLGFFKYYNFFVDNFVSAFQFFGQSISPNTLHIILPVGISFYTFQTLSYTIDVYNKKLKPTSNFIAFAAFVSFFPQLVAGPIERATHLLPQFYKKRTFNYNNAIDGMRQILWGLFKKVVIADNCAEYVNVIFNSYGDQTGSTLILGAFFFAFQIYGDFSGYSDIAIGTSRLFGFDLMKNFAFPYFSRDIAEFWRRWHISLSTWFRDYLYIPLGGSKGNKKLKIRNIFIIFLVSGFWHGANWTFIIWGALNAIYFLPLMLTNKNRNNLDIVAQNQWLPSFKELLNIMITFMLTLLAWIFFRSDTVSDALSYIINIFNSSLFTVPQLSENTKTTLVLILFFIGIEWIGRRDAFAISKIGKLPIYIRWMFYFILIILMFIYTGKEQAFIYFQF